jgi:peptidoglycan/xylan/chitin deacetylase (PgdA/CDA1 family)
MLRTRHIPYANRKKGASLFPDGARMAVLVYCALEEWDWNRPYGPDYRPNSDHPASAASKVPDWSMQSAVEYGFRVGLPRYADVLADFDLQSTFLTNGLAAEQWPEITRELAAAGHEISGHSYDQGVRLGGLGRDEQEPIIQHGLDSIEAIVGARPLGWVSPAAAATRDTVILLAAQGLLYHGDLQDDELPYFIDSNGHTMVEIPYRMIANLNDKILFTRPQRTADEALAYASKAFETHYEAAAATPLILNLGLHPLIIGRADAAWVFKEFLTLVTSKQDVWIPTYQDLARWWLAEHDDMADLVTTER